MVEGPSSIVPTLRTSATDGRVRWAPAKSFWIGGMTLVAVALGPIYVSRGAIGLFVVASALTLCFGHSVGMHRRLIHRSFECPRWVEYLCVYLGTLVGMAGPIGMIRLHDHRDWAQRQRACHDYLCHRRSFWVDAWWQLHCELVLARPPQFRLDDEIADDRFYRWLEDHWMLQQLPWALLFYVIGGPAWVVWGICMRVAVCVSGHWLVGHFAHRQGEQTWTVDGAAAQGYNVRLAGLISMGESWHNNHHAFPGSARLGILPGQADPGWWLICVFRSLGLATNIVTPEQLPARPALRRVAADLTDAGYANRVLKVNHAGEHGAVQLYAGQILAARLTAPRLLDELREFQANEERHRAIFEAELARRNTPRCRSLQLCGIGGFALGVITGLFGSRAIGATTVAVEGVVLRHLHGQLSQLRQSDKAAAHAVSRILEEEQQHFDRSREHAQAGCLSATVTPVITAVTETVIWLGMRL